MVRIFGVLLLGNLDLKFVLFQGSGENVRFARYQRSYSFNKSETLSTQKP